MSTLLASAPTLPRILNLVTQFYVGTEMTLEPDGNEWRIRRSSDGKLLDGVRVRKVKARFRFEMV